jgi:hypothetical protein
VLTPLLAASVLAGSALLFFVRWRAALLLLAVPIYYLLTESCFLLEWRVVVPMHYGLFVAAGAVISVIVAPLAGRATRRAPPLNARAGSLAP